MQPQQPYYGPPQPAAPPPSPGQNPYDFIVNSNKPPRNSLFGGGSSRSRRIAIIAGGAIAVIILFIIVINLLSGGGGNAAADIKVAQDQTEIARVAALGVQQQDIGQNAKNVALTIQLSLTSDRQQLLDYLQKNGVKVSPKDLAALQNSQIDQQLTNAAANSNYDSTFLGIMKTDLGDYQQRLQAAFDSSKSTTIRQLLKGQYDNAGLLLEQIKNNQN